MILVLIPKGDMDTWGIVLLESLWKVVEATIDTRMKASTGIHDFLHGFRAERGMGKAILELKTDQELAVMYQDPLFLVFIDLQKTYDTVDRGHLLMLLEGYGASPRMCRLLEVFWNRKKSSPTKRGIPGRTSRQLREPLRTDSSCPPC